MIPQEQAPSKIIIYIYIEYKFIYQFLLYINFRMREKRQKKVNKHYDQDSTPQRQGKRKKIQKGRKKQTQEKYEEKQYNNDANQSPNGEEKKENNESKQQNQKSSQNKEAINDQKMELQLNTSKNKKRQNCQPQSKLQSLAKLNENYRQIKTIYDQYLSKYNNYRAECQELSHKVRESRTNIQVKSKQLKELSKNIYLECLNNSKQLFFNVNTFTDGQKFQKFIQSLEDFAETMKSCPYQDPIQNLQLTHVQPDDLVVHCVGQHKRQKIIKNFLLEFPYLTVSSQSIPLIKNLIKSTKFIESQRKYPLLQFPSLFTRNSSISNLTIQQINFALFKLFNEPSKKLLRLILRVVQEQSTKSDRISIQNIQELVMKGLNKTRFICLPEILLELRGLCFGGYLYVNTYYVEKDQSLTKEVIIAYCMLVMIRELANYVVKSIVYSLNKSDENIGKTIQQFKQRSDAGAKLERIIAKNKNFITASSEDYKIIFQNQAQKFEFLGQNSNQFQNYFVFEEQRQRRKIMTTSILHKYDVNTHKNDSEIAPRMIQQGHQKHQKGQQFLKQNQFSEGIKQKQISARLPQKIQNLINQNKQDIDQAQCKPSSEQGMKLLSQNKNVDEHAQQHQNSGINAILMELQSQPNNFPCLM